MFFTRVPEDADKIPRGSIDEIIPSLVIRT